MKGIVVDIDGLKAVAMTDDGEITMLPEGQYTLGQEVYITAESEWKTVRTASRGAADRRRLRQRIASIAAAFAVGLAGMGTYAYASPYGVVSLDVNPSIEYTINRFDRVLSVEMVGMEDENDTLELSSLKNKKLDDAVSDTLTKLDQAEYFDEDTNYVVMAANTKNDDHTAMITARMDNLVNDFNDRRAVVENVEAPEAPSVPEIKSVSVSVSEDDVQRAKEFDTTPGKLWLVEKVSEGEGLELQDEEFEEMLQMPVRDIVDGPGGGKLPSGRPESGGPGFAPDGEAPAVPDGEVFEGPDGSGFEAPDGDVPEAGAPEGEGFGGPSQDGFGGPEGEGPGQGPQDGNN